MPICNLVQFWLIFYMTALINSGLDLASHFMQNTVTQNISDFFHWKKLFINTLKNCNIHFQSLLMQPTAVFSASVLASVALDSKLPDCAGFYQDIHNL